MCVNPAFETNRTTNRKTSPRFTVPGQTRIPQRVKQADETSLTEQPAGQSLPAASWKDYRGPKFGVSRAPILLNLLSALARPCSLAMEKIILERKACAVLGLKVISKRVQTCVLSRAILRREGAAFNFRTLARGQVSPLASRISLAAHPSKTPQGGASLL